MVGPFINSRDSRILKARTFVRELFFKDGGEGEFEPGYVAVYTFRASFSHSDTLTKLFCCQTSWVATEAHTIGSWSETVKKRIYID